MAGTKTERRVPLNLTVAEWLSLFRVLDNPHIRSGTVMTEADLKAVGNLQCQFGYWAGINQRHDLAPDIYKMEANHG